MKVQTKFSYRSTFIWKLSNDDKTTSLLWRAREMCDQEKWKIRRMEEGTITDCLKTLSHKCNYLERRGNIREMKTAEFRTRHLRTIGTSSKTQWACRIQFVQLHLLQTARNAALCYNNKKDSCFWQYSGVDSCTHFSHSLQRRDNKNCFYAYSQNCESDYYLRHVWLSVRQYISLHGTTYLPLDGFWWNVTFEQFFKPVDKIQVSLKSDKNNGCFTWRSFHIYDISLNSS